MTPVRVLHFADLHIGIENYGSLNPTTGLNQRVHDFVARLDELVAYAREHEADLIVFAGDAFHNSRPDPTFQRAFAFRVLQLSEIAPVILLVGNHDIQTNSSKASAVDIYQTLSVPNVYVVEEYSVLSVETRRGTVVVGTAPFPTRTRLLETVTGLKSMREVQDMLKEVLTQTLNAMAEKADAIAGDAPRLLLGHFTVDQAEVGSERRRMLATDESVMRSTVADARWDYVALGHIHKFQDLTAGRQGVPPVVYSGSVERIDFGEEGEEKGFCWVELARGRTRYDFVPLAARPMITLDVDCRDADQPNDRVLERICRCDLKDAIVRLRLHLTGENHALLDEGRLRAALRRAEVHHIAALECRVERAHRARLGLTSEELTHEQLLEQYFIAKGKSPEEIATLLALARPLMAE